MLLHQSISANDANNEVPTPVQFIGHLRLAIVEWQALQQQQRLAARRANTNGYSLFLQTQRGQPVVGGGNYWMAQVGRRWRALSDAEQARWTERGLEQRRQEQAANGEQANGRKTYLQWLSKYNGGHKKIH